MQSLNIDLTSYSETKRTFIDIFGIHDREYLISELFNGSIKEYWHIKSLTMVNDHH
ncbi:hypothetical protein [Paenibacillus sp. GCM10028914]|uniref:hypothetical protein n=1 Tax=Paenibacillus sp. GCM10028914 TaxID=3273416 RepID=UPI00360702A0